MIELISPSVLPKFSAGILSYTVSSKSVQEGMENISAAPVNNDIIDFLFIINNDLF